MSMKTTYVSDKQSESYSEDLRRELNIFEATSGIVKCFILATCAASGFSVALLSSVSLHAQHTQAQIDSVLANTRWEGMKDIVPKHYIAAHTTGTILIDGRLDEQSWRDAPWSQPFVDIEGDRKPLPRFQTRMKIIWDDQYLYIAAEMEEPHLWATLTEKNSVIYQDHDFEVFIDPNADNHNYYEFEVNAFNTIWELRMIRPYRDGGPNINPDNTDGVLSVVYLDGSINDPSDIDSGWTVELAFPWSGFDSYGTDGAAPTPGDQWRINFSRVQRRLQIVNGEYVSPRRTPPCNWVWSAQGAIAMHMPERWGFLQFAIRGDRSEVFVPDPTLVARDLLMEIHYLQKAYNKLTRTYAGVLDELGLTSVRGDYLIDLWSDGSTFTAMIENSNDATPPAVFYINERGHLWRGGL